MLVGWMITPVKLVGDVRDVVSQIEPEDIYDPWLRSVYTAAVIMWERGEMVAPLMLPENLDRARMVELAAYGDQMLATQPIVDAVVEASRARHLLAAAYDAVTMVRDGVDTAAIAEDLQAQVEISTKSRSIETEAVQWGEVLNWDTARSPWVVDGLIRRGHRALFVAGEGAGKTLLLRQIAMCASAGLHPFGAVEALQNGPARTLTIDLENPADQIKDHGQWILGAIARKKPDLDLGSLPAWLVSWPGRIDIRRRRDRMRLENEIRSKKPDLVCMGPVYRLFAKTGHETDEEVIGEVTEILDSLRDRYGFAIMLEHHAPHAPSNGKRSMRPVGSSYWLRWPEYGFGLTPVKVKAGQPPEFKLERFRGDRVRGAVWPETIRHGNLGVGGQKLPWLGVYPDGTLNAARAETPTPEGEPF